MKRNSFTLTCMAATAMFAAILGACSKQEENANQKTQDAMPLKVLTVEPSSTVLYNTYPATIKGQKDVAIRPQVSGFITEVLVDEGQFVHKGQPLFTIDKVQFQAAVDQAQAAVNAARTAVDNAKIQADNNNSLYSQNIISLNAKQVSDNQLRQAQAQLSQAQAALTAANKNLSYTTVVAPSDGVVGSIPNREGSLASPSSAQPLTTISDISEVYAYFALTEKDLLNMTDGGTKNINDAVKQMPEVSLILANGNVYPEKGKVMTISGVIDNSTGTATARARFDNPAGMLRSGNTGQINIPVQSENVIVIPQKATYEVQDLKYVFTLNDSNKTVPTRIDILNLNDGKNYVVTGGLTPGDRVVIEGIGTNVRPGMLVSPVDPNAQPQPAQ